MSDTIRTQKALDPRGLFNDIAQAQLAPRPDTLSGKTLYFVHSWAANSGFEGFAARLRSHLLDKYAGLTIEERHRIVYSADDPALWAEMREKADAFVYFAAPAGSTTASAIAWPARALERAGIPGVSVVYAYLEPDALLSKDREGMEIRHVCLPYPCTDLGPAETDAAIGQIEDALFRPRTEQELVSGLRTPTQPPRYCAEGTDDELLDYFFTNGLTDGLPIVPPTEARVEAMLRGTSHPREEVVVTQMAPESRKVTVEKVAINAVMAGAAPSYMPVLLAVTEILGRDQSFHATTKSTNSFSYMQVVNGPIRNELGMNGGVYALGAGNRANAVIGRFLRLALQNLGGCQVGVNLMGVQGNVSTYTFAFAENEEASPWEPLSRRLGYGEDESVVTIFSGGWAHCGNYMLKQGTREIHRALTQFELPGGFTVLLSPRRAQELAAEGCSTMAETEDYFWRNTTVTIGELRERGILGANIARDQKMGTGLWPAEYLTLPDDAVVPMFPQRRVNVVVVGDPKGSNVMQGWSMYSPRSASVDKWR